MPSAGALRVEIFTLPQPFFSLEPRRYLVNAVEMTEAYVPIRMELESSGEVAKLLGFCRNSAKARQLTLKVCNFTREPNEIFGIVLEELKA